MLRVLSVCLSVVLVGVFLTYYGRVAPFLVGLLFSFVNEHLDEPVEMLSFPPSIFGSRFWFIFAATFCNTCNSQLRSWFIFFIIILFYLFFFNNR